MINQTTFHTCDGQMQLPAKWASVYSILAVHVVTPETSTTVTPTTSSASVLITSTVVITGGALYSITLGLDGVAAVAPSDSTSNSTTSIKLFLNSGNSILLAAPAGHSISSVKFKSNASDTATGLVMNFVNPDMRI